MKKMRTLETMAEESSWPSRRRWNARVGYGEGFFETRSLGRWILGNMMDGRWEGMTALFALIDFFQRCYRRRQQRWGNI